MLKCNTFVRLAETQMPTKCLVHLRETLCLAQKSNWASPGAKPLSLNNCCKHIYVCQIS